MFCRRFLGSALLAPLALSTALLGCVPREYVYDYSIEIGFGSESDVTVAAEDAPLIFDISVMGRARDCEPGGTDMSGDPITCTDGYGPSKFLIGPPDDLREVPPGGGFVGYVGGPIELRIFLEYQNREFAYRMTIPTFHNVTLDPDPMDLDAPATVRWDPYGEPGVTASVAVRRNVSGPEGNFSSFPADEEEGELVLDPTMFEVGSYQFQVRRAAFSAGPDVLPQDTEVTWDVAAYLDRNRIADVTSSTP